MIRRQNAEPDLTGRKVKGTIHWVAAKTCQKSDRYVSMRTLSMNPKGVYNEDGSLNLNRKRQPLT